MVRSLSGSDFLTIDHIIDCHSPFPINQNLSLSSQNIRKVSNFPDRSVPH